MISLGRIHGQTAVGELSYILARMPHITDCWLSLWVCTCLTTVRLLWACRLSLVTQWFQVAENKVSCLADCSLISDWSSQAAVDAGLSPISLPHHIPPSCLFSFISLSISMSLFLLLFCVEIYCKLSCTGDASINTPSLLFLSFHSWVWCHPELWYLWFNNM